MAARIRSTYEVRLAIRSPFLFRGLTAKLFGVDATQIRDEEGYPIIPSDQVRGVIRDGLERLVQWTGGKAISEEIVRDLFGQASLGKGETDDARGNTNDPNRGRIHFSDLTARKQLAGKTEQNIDRNAGLETTRVRIDEETGAAATGALQVLELVTGFDAVALFEGSIVVFEARSGEFSKVLAQALAITPSIGAFKSSGFGVIDQDNSYIKLKPAPQAAKPSKVAADDGVVRLRVTFDRPVMVAADKIADNASAGAAVLPGAVFKGALAGMMKQWGETPESSGVLSRMIFTHAFPEEPDTGGKSNLPLPLSLVAEKAGELLKYGDALLIGPDDGAWISGCEQAAKFTTDWKEAWFYGVSEALGRTKHVDIPAIARTHVAIERESGTAKDQALYTTLARSSRAKAGDDGWQDRVWLFEVSLGMLAGAEREEALRILSRMVAEGLDGVGRTSASARFSVDTNRKLEQPAPMHGHADEFTLMLLTPALLLDPKLIWDKAGKEKLSARDAYVGYFKSVLPRAELVNFYAAQALAGGYQARRFRAYGPDKYLPFLLTKPGSIFRFKGVFDTTTMAGFLRSGLPLPKLTEAAPLTWRNCPYVPENGFGHFTMRHLSDETTMRLADAVTAV